MVFCCSIIIESFHYVFPILLSRRVITILLWIQVRNDKARKYLTDMRKKQPVPFSHKFPNADPLALRLLQRLLSFDPKDRPTAEQVGAVSSPFFLFPGNVTFLMCEWIPTLYSHTLILPLFSFVLPVYFFADPNANLKTN